METHEKDGALIKADFDYFEFNWNKTCLMPERKNTRVWYRIVFSYNVYKQVKKPKQTLKQKNPVGIFWL